MLLAVAVAAAADGGINWIEELIRGGPFALVLILILLDKLGTNSERDRLRTENAALREQVTELNKEVRDKIVPPLTELNGHLAKVVELLARGERRSPSSER